MWTQTQVLLSHGAVTYRMHSLNHQGGLAGPWFKGRTDRFFSSGTAQEQLSSGQDKAAGHTFSTSVINR